ncbi:hypothetical protein LIER_06387 [Lithospermum erythrorhizon]|uniref:Uncharacterized protein n=1 Tax=Lithospermum erythrorhizon TaxID=34254 RepID=A0AAV3P8X4_LITER
MVRLEEEDLADGLVACEASAYVKVLSLREGFISIKNFSMPMANSLNCKDLRVSRAAGLILHVFFALPEDKKRVLSGGQYQLLIFCDWVRGADPTNFTYNTYIFWIQGRGLKDEFYTRDVALKLAFSFHNCETVEQPDDFNTSLPIFQGSSMAEALKFFDFNMNLPKLEEGHHEVDNQKHSWNLMRIVTGFSKIPTIFMRDFNEVLSDDEYVSHRRHRSNWQMDNFRQVVNDCRMIEVGYSGFKFTWCNNFIAPNSTRARLDRCLASKAWMDKFPLATLDHLSTNNSDHLPLLLNWGGSDKSVATKALATVLAKEIDKLREADELYWCERSRVTWRVKGDRNTTFFHAVSAERGKKTLITALQDDKGTWQRDFSQIQVLASQFYDKLFTSESRDHGIDLSQLQTSKFSEEVLQGLESEFTSEEIKRCLFTMEGTKAPGPDGMPSLFFQHYREIVG